MNIKTVLNSGNVVRFHNHVGIDKQKISEHQWGVALVAQFIDPNCSKDLILACITHDAAEYYMGDIPANVKWDNPKVKTVFEEIETKWEKKNGVYFELSPNESVILKMADMLEGMHYCIKQVRRGHRDAIRPFRKWRSAFYERFIGEKHLYPKAFNLFDSLITKMEEL